MAKGKKVITPYLYLLPTIVLMCILLIIPIVMVISYSFYDNVIINKNPVFVGLKNYATVLTDPTFLVAIKNTLLFVLISIVAHFLIGMLFAMLLNTRYLGITAKGIFRVIYALPWMFTASVIAIVWRMMLNPNGVLNFLMMNAGIISEKVEWLASRDVALSAVTVINIWSGYPFYMISILAGLQGISMDLYEASALDGANAVQTFFRITIPQLKPILVSLLMLDFVWTLQQFALIWMTTGGGPVNATETISTYIYKQGFSKYQYSMASAGAVILLIICTIIGIFYVRQQKAGD
ncbi:carbohydrate ABC transporter permease [Schaedlerella arabinosiphila]